jgi:hypothetical protein
MKDVVFDILQTMLSNSPEASYKRLNPALRSTLANCIEADLPFQRDTFRRIFNDLRGRWWFGDGAGSHIGEGFYTLAVQVNHASAYQSFEQFAERPGVLWEQDSAAPSRLHVGARFSWKGHYVTVTSMRSDSLVACTYKDVAYAERGISVGSEIGYDNPYVVTSCKRSGNTAVLRVVKSAKENGSRTIARRFTITYEDIEQFRRTEKARVKAVIERIEKCDPIKDGQALAKEIAAQHFRHFQLELINAAFAKRKDLVANADRIEAWRNGANGAWLETHAIVLRVSGDLVECSNGNRVSLASAKRALPIILDKPRNKTERIGLTIDGHTIERTGPEGVTIGCTLVPWDEVDRLSKLVAAT